jgi:hypothetical protein
MIEFHIHTATENSTFEFEDEAVFMVFDYMDFDLSGLMSSTVRDRGFCQSYDNHCSPDPDFQSNPKLHQTNFGRIALHPQKQYLAQRHKRCALCGCGLISAATGLSRTIRCIF